MRRALVQLRAVARPLARSALAHPTILAIVCAGGLLLTFAVWRTFDQWEQRALGNELQSLAEARSQSLVASLNRSTDVLHSIASLMAARSGDGWAGSRGGGDNASGIARDEFRRFVLGALARQPELRAIGWTPRVPADCREAYERAARADGLAGFRFLELAPDGRPVPAATREEYYPVYFLEPAATNGLALGFELDSDPARAAALSEAAHSGRPTLAGPIHLVQERSGALGLIVYLAIRQTPPGNGTQEGALLGFGSAVYRLSDLIHKPRPTSADTDDGISLTLRDSSAGELFRSGKSATDGVAAKTADANIDWGGRRWTLTVSAGPSFLARHRRRESIVAAIAGVAITVLLTAFIGNGLRRRAQIERAVRERTAELRTEAAQRERAVVAARDAERKFRGIFENAVEGIFQTTPDGHYLSTNPALARIYGYDSPGQLVAALTNIAGQLYVDPGRREEFVRLIRRDGLVSGFESQVYRRDGQVIWIAENARAVRDDRGDLLYFEGMVVEVTERKAAEAMLRRDRDLLDAAVRARTAELSAANEALCREVAERRRAEDVARSADRAKTTFLANMSHEIRTPMNAILGYAQLLATEPDLPVQQREVMCNVLSSGRHLLGLIDEILDLSKIESGRADAVTAPFSPAAVLREVVTMFLPRCRERGLWLTLTEDGHLPDCAMGDERKFRQVLINLVANAVRFTETGGVTIEVVPGGDGVSWRFDVIDTGVGIRADDLEEVFEPFRQATVTPLANDAGRHAGTGLGLSIARACLKAMGGRLRVASEPGRGTRFVVDLPLPAAPTADSASRVVVSNAPHLPAVRVAAGRVVHALVVDDDADSRFILCEVLRRIGCEPLAAASAQEGMELAAVNAFDVAVIDIRLSGADGVEVGRRIRAQSDAVGRPIMLVATSASVLAKERAGYLAGGFDAFLPKPISFDAVARVFAEVPGIAVVTSPPQELLDAEPIAAGAEDVSLSVSLRRRIIRAARACNVTELRKCVAEAERETPAAATLGLVRDGLRTYDMDRIVGVLGYHEDDSIDKRTDALDEQFGPGDPLCRT